MSRLVTSYVFWQKKDQIAQQSGDERETAFLFKRLSILVHLLISYDIFCLCLYTKFELSVSFHS